MQSTIYMFYNVIYHYFYTYNHYMSNYTRKMVTPSCRKDPALMKVLLFYKGKISGELLDGWKHYEVVGLKATRYCYLFKLSIMLLIFS